MDGVRRALESPSPYGERVSSPAAGPSPTSAVRAVEVTKEYGTGESKVAALRGVSVDFPAGVFTAIMGPSGSGKSTLMHCLAGLDTVTKGRVWLAGGNGAEAVELSALSDRKLTQL